jgi:DNA polymerase/3'-5' exonuclease PolX
MPFKPIMSISGSEPRLLKEGLADVSVVDNKQIYPDIRIYSRLGYTVGVARATTNDLVSNKTDVSSHVVEELYAMKDDVRIFLMEDWMGRDRYGKISLPGSQRRNREYSSVINMVMSACLATGSLWVPSASLTATIELLKHWNAEYFQREVHSSLTIRPRRAEQYFSLDLDEDDIEGSNGYRNKVWWLSDIPGLNIGIKRAETLLENGDSSLMDLFIKTPEQLAKYPGVGKKIAIALANFLYTKRTNKGDNVDNGSAK